MTTWKKYKLGDLVTFQRGHDLPVSKFENGNYPVAGSNGIIGYHNSYTAKGPSLTLGRSGKIGGAHYYESDFWAHNTTLYVKAFHNSDPKFMYYLLKSIDLTGHNSGSAVPSLNRNFINPIEVLAPDLPTQRLVSETLSSLDDKIELNRRMNQTLEQMALTLFRHYFMVNINEENLPEGWKLGKIIDLFELQRGYDLPAPKRTAGSVPVFAAGGLNGFHNEAMVKGPGITTGRSGVIGNVYYISEDFWPLNTSLFIKRYNASTPLHAFYVLKFTDLKGLNTGSAVPTLNRNEVHSLEAIVPSKEAIIKFEEEAKLVFQKIRHNEKEIDKLTQLRDTLLPKLMSGEIDVMRTQPEALHEPVLS